ncbi:MAG: hypothetical protein AABX55_02225 [Nanoarchaeota archaeon]
MINPFKIFKKKKVEQPEDIAQDFTQPFQDRLPLEREYPGLDKEDLILSKLETINAKLDNINERLKKIEELAK